MVCCSLSGILWQMELVKGKDSPSEIIPKYNNQGKTVGLLLHVSEPIFTRGNVVILDSGFCMLNGIVELKKRGVYASTLIKSGSICPNISRVMQSETISTTKMLVIATHGRALWRKCPSMYMQ